MPAQRRWYVHFAGLETVNRTQINVVEPLFAFAFVQTFVDILTEYFATVNAVTLKDNFDVVYQVS